MIEIRFMVDGLPAPKGSPRVYVRDARGRPLRRPKVRADSDATEAWATAVGWCSKRAMIGEKPFRGSALRLDLLLYMPRPESHLRRDRTIRASAPAFPMTKPDGDKLQRTTQDAMQGIVFDEDSRIVDWHGYKRYAPPGGSPWACLRVSVHVDVDLKPWHPGRF